MNTTAEFPVLLTVTVCWELGAIPPGLTATARATVCSAKLRLVGENEIPDVAPIPFSATLCGLPLVLSVMLSVALTEPAACGLKSTKSAQLAPGGKDPVGNEHAFVPRTKYPKLVEAVPVIAMFIKFNCELPTFVSVTD